MARDRWRYTRRATPMSYGLPTRIAISAPPVLVTAYLVHMGMRGLLDGNPAAAIPLALSAFVIVPAVPVLWYVWQPEQQHYTDEAEDLSQRLATDLSRDRAWDQWGPPGSRVPDRAARIAAASGQTPQTPPQATTASADPTSPEPGLAAPGWSPAGWARHVPRPGEVGFGDVGDTAWTSPTWPGGPPHPPDTPAG